jgi:hypothetical protein
LYQTYSATVLPDLKVDAVILIFKHSLEKTESFKMAYEALYHLKGELGIRIFLTNISDLTISNLGKDDD